MKEKKSSYFTATWKMLAAVIIGGIAGGVSVVIYELDYEEEKWGAWTSGVNLVSQVACIIILSFGYSLKYIESGKSRCFLFACIIFIL